MKYFKNIDTLQELRKQYKELLKQYHPDNKDGSEEATKEINTEYESLFKVLKNQHENKSEQTDNKTTYNDMKYDFSEDAKLRETLSKVIHLSNITIEIIGAWIWINGNTYQHKDILKELGFKYAGQKKMWYWHSEAFIKRSHKVLSINDIRNYYGSTEVQTEERKMLKQA